MIKLKNISKYYSKNQVVSLGLRKINLEFGLNEFVAIVGESGSGKTTLLNVISGIDSYEEGEMYINNEETSYFSSADWENYRKKYIAFIFQSYNLIESYTVLQNVEAALILSGYPKDELRNRALEIIERVGLTEHIKHKATKLSGGQKQRVVIARAIAKDAPLIVADEPTGNLDSESAQKIIDLLAEIAKDKLVIVVTHDFSQVQSQATRRIRIFDGEIVEDKKIIKKDIKDLPNLDDKDYHMDFKETIKMVFRNLIATPKKSILLMVIFLFSTFFFAFIYASFLLNQATQTSPSGLDFEPNTRVLVNKTDGTAFSQEELLSFEENKRVNAIVYYDFLFEAQNNIGARIRDVASGGATHGYSPLILPISILGSDHDNLNPGEVAISLAYAEEMFETSNMDDLLGYEVSLYERTSNVNIESRFDVAYVYDYLDVFDQLGEGAQTSVFLSDEDWYDLGKAVGFVTYTSVNVTSTYLGQTITRGDSSANIVLNTSFDDDEIIIPAWMTNNNQLMSPHFEMGEIVLSTQYNEVVYTDLDVSYSNENIIEVSQAIYDDFFNVDQPYQVSLFANDGIDGVNLSDQLENSGDYEVFYPAGVETNNQLSGLVFLIMNIGFFFSFGLLFIIIFFVAYVIIKNIINSKLSDYAIFRTIGANKSTIRSFIYLETLFIAFLAYFVFVVFVQIGSPYFKATSIFYNLKFYTFKNLLYLLIFIAAYSLLLSRRYVSRVYHDTVAQTLKGEAE